MKNFLKIFVLLEILLFAYILTAQSTIYVRKTILLLII